MLRRDPSGGLWLREALAILECLLRALSVRFARLTTLITGSTSNCPNTGNFKKPVRLTSISVKWPTFSAKRRSKGAQ